jgi:hypothetical protein
MGRPPIGKHAMSAAERQRRHRAQFRDTKPVTKPTAPQPDERDREIAALKARVAELERQLALAQMATGKVPKTVAEMMAIKRIADEVKAAERAAAKAARQAKAPPVDADETLETLTAKLRQRDQQLKSAKTRIRHLIDESVALRGRKTIAVSKELLRTMRAKMHPDTVTDPKERNRLTRLSQEFNSFKFVTPDDA